MGTALTVAVIDASALAALCFAEPGAACVAGQLAGVRLIAPTLLPYDLAQVAWKKCRRHTHLQAQIAQQLDQWRRFDIELVAVPADRAFTAAAGTDLTAHEASYLWLARTAGVALVTLDRALAAAAH